MKTSRQVVTDFLNQFVLDEQDKKILFLNFSTPQILNVLTQSQTEIKLESDFENIKSRQFDLIIGDLPFGLQSVLVDTVSKLKINKNWSYILTSLRTLKDGGEAFFLVEPSILFSQQGKRFINDLALESYFYNSVFELPEKLLYPATAFQPIIIHFEKRKQKELFIGEVSSDYESLIKSFISRTSSSNLATGIIIPRKDFESFHKFRIENEINNLQTQYKEYSKYKLNEVALEINLTREHFQEKPNSIYIPKIGPSPVVAAINETKIKHQNLFQIVLNPNIVKSEFLALFFHSDLGKQILRSLTSGSFIPNINKSDLESCYVSVPSLQEQSLLVLTNQKLSEIQNTINQLKAELSLNPKSATVILDKFESIQSPLKQLSIEDQILGLIRKGENKHIEFKESFSKNTRTGQKDKEIEKTSLKNIVGFLNADGGVLLIGIADNGEVKGVEDDFFTTADKYKLNFKNAINSKVGSEFYSLIDYELFNVGGRLVLKVDCKASNEPCFYDQTEFFVRTNPATDKLEGKKQIDYIRERFR
ncbi:RNA-binding domain-containing protein [Runella sp.]|uniref:RNA-binding domain-containing protein n=1 Tax=Runella sp. TaxID=1960881 RepID=UPI00261034B4|nr:RNA-binding domain-containing protein [Runella sp.]